MVILPEKIQLLDFGQRPEIMARYVTLTSDASKDIFPQNQIGSFRIKLPRKIYLDRERHQLGLKFISYPMSSHNVEDGTFSVSFVDATNYGTPSIQFDTEIEAGYYSSPGDLVNTINDTIASIPDQFPETYAPLAEHGIRLERSFIFFAYSEHTEKVSILQNATDRYVVSIRMSKELYVKLGFGLEEEARLMDGTCCRFFEIPKKAPQTADLNSGRSALFVYTDIIESDRIVGHRLVPLLALAPLTGRHGQQCYYEPIALEYHKPRYDVIEEILIELTGDTGQVLRFTSGKVYITLHIRDKLEQ